FLLRLQLGLGMRFENRARGGRRRNDGVGDFSCGLAPVGVFGVDGEAVGPEGARVDRGAVRDRAGAGFHPRASGGGAGVDRGYSLALGVGGAVGWGGDRDRGRRDDGVGDFFGRGAPVGVFGSDGEGVGPKRRRIEGCAVCDRAFAGDHTGASGRGAGVRGADDFALGVDGPVGGGRDRDRWWRDDGVGHFFARCRAVLVFGVDGEGVGPEGARVERRTACDRAFAFFNGRAFRRRAGIGGADDFALGVGAAAGGGDDFDRWLDQ